MFPSHLTWNMLAFVHFVFASVQISVSPWKMLVVFPFSFLKIDFMFLEQFWVHSKIEWKVQYLPYTSCPYTCVASSINITPQGTFVMIDEPTCLYYLYYAESIVHIRVHSQCYTFHVFGQTYNGLDLLL